MKTYVATKNLGKLGELRSLFAGSPLDLDVYPLYAQPEEDAQTYAGNAAIKARRLRGQLRDAGVDGAVLADDSGLEVEVLAGRPGIRSARYGGDDATWPRKRELLLAELRGVPIPSRGAKFCCALVLIDGEGRVYEGYGEVAGVMACEERGRFGFGYDPVFIDPSSGRSFAELSTQEKERISHRRIAADALLAALTRRG